VTRLSMLAAFLGMRFIVIGSVSETVRAVGAAAVSAAAKSPSEAALARGAASANGRQATKQIRSAVQRR